MRNQLERAVERISNCALRENIVNSISGVNQRLEKQINEKFKHFKDHLTSMDEQIQKNKAEANTTILSVKKRTLGKITDCENLMNKKISEVRLKDCLEGLKKGLQDQISKQSTEQTSQLKSLENKHSNKISDLEDEFQIEIANLDTANISSDSDSKLIEEKINGKAIDLMNQIEKRVEKQSLEVSISSINEKIIKSTSKLRETSKFLDNLYGNVEMLNKNFEETKNLKEYVQEIEENVSNLKTNFVKDIEKIKNWIDEKFKEPQAFMKHSNTVSNEEVDTLKIQLNSIQNNLTNLEEGLDNLNSKTNLKIYKSEVMELIEEKMDKSEVYEFFDRSKKKDEKSKQNKLLDVIRLIQRNYKKSLASSKVLNCLSCGRGDANFENQPLYIKGENNKFFVNKLPNAASKNTRFKKPRGQSAFVVNHRINQLGQSVSTISRVNESARRKKSGYTRPQTGVKRDLYYETPNEVDYGVDFFNRNKAMEDHVKNRHQLGQVHRVKRGHSANVKRSQNQENRRDHKKLPSLMGEHRSSNQDWSRPNNKNNSSNKNNFSGNMIQGQIPKIDEEEENEWMKNSILEAKQEITQTPNSKTQQSQQTNDWNMNKFSEQAKLTETPKADNPINN